MENIFACAERKRTKTKYRKREKEKLWQFLIENVFWKFFARDLEVCVPVSGYDAYEERCALVFLHSNFIIENRCLYSDNKGEGGQRNRDHRKEEIEVKR